MIHSPYCAGCVEIVDGDDFVSDHTRKWHVNCHDLFLLANKKGVSSMRISGTFFPPEFTVDSLIKTDGNKVDSLDISLFKLEGISRLYCLKCKTEEDLLQWMAALGNESKSIF
ncbi:hypothetical protein WA158_004415 [Blastocystis sp. Blastoise]